MSSKEQYKNVIKRQKQIISKLIVQNNQMEQEVKKAKISFLKLKEILNKKRSLKKWWQFWK